MEKHIVIGELEYFIQKCGNQKVAAEKLGVSESYLSDILNGKREITEKLGNKLGWKLVRTWVYDPHAIDIRQQGGISQKIRWQPRESWELKRSFANWNNGWTISSPKVCGVADGIHGRTPILHAFGNAIVPAVAAEFIKATM